MSVLIVFSLYSSAFITAVEGLAVDASLVHKCLCQNQLVFVNVPFHDKKISPRILEGDGFSRKKVLTLACEDSSRLLSMTSRFIE